MHTRINLPSSFSDDVIFEWNDNVSAYDAKGSVNCYDIENKTDAKSS